MPSFGQSPFALARGNQFEAGLFRNDAQLLRAALERKDVLPHGSGGFLDLRLTLNGGSKLKTIDDALTATEAWLARIASHPDSAESIIAGPMLKIPKGVILPEALLIVDAVALTRVNDKIQLSVGEIKVFPDRGGHTDPAQISSARAQAGVYLHAFDLVVDKLGITEQIDVLQHGFLVFTWPGSNSPAVRSNEDLRYQALRAQRGFERLEEVAQLFTRDDDFSATQTELIERVLKADTSYAEGCLAFCDLAPRCHKNAVEGDSAKVLGDDMSALLGDLTLTRALELLNGAIPANTREADLKLQLGSL